MSCYIAKFKNKKTGEIIEVYCIDNYFGRHNYGYKTPDGVVYKEEEFYQLYEREK